MVFLDDERIVLTPGPGGHRDRLRSPGGAAHTAVRRELVGSIFHGQRRVQVGQKVAVFREALEHILEAQLRQPRRLELLPRSRCSDGRRSATAHRIRRNRRLLSVVLRPVHEDAAGAFGLGHRRGHPARIAFFEQRRNTLGDGGRPGRCQRFLQRGFLQRDIQVNTLATAGDGEGRESDLGDHVPDLAGDLRALRQIDIVTRVQVENHSRRRAR